MNVPSPLELAMKMDLTDICNILNQTQSDSDDDDDIAQYDTSFKQDEQNANQCNANESCSQTINRLTPGFLTGVVGD